MGRRMRPIRAWLVHVEEWLRDSALVDLLGLQAEQFNDDRLARALGLLLPHLNAVWQELIERAVTTWGLDLHALCYDITSISFCGEYEEEELVRYGYSRNHRPDRKQIELAATVTAAGGIPIDYRPLAGNVADCTTPVENLHRLQAVLATLPLRAQAAPSLVISERGSASRDADLWQSAQPACSQTLSASLHLSLFALECPNETARTGRSPAIAPLSHAPSPLSASQCPKNVAAIPQLSGEVLTPCEIQT